MKVLDTYVIDEAAAKSDMAKIRQAVAHLKQARQSVTLLMNNAQNMRGETGRAIEEKCQELQVRIDTLTRQLNSSEYLLGVAVSHYQAIDSKHDRIFGK